MAPRITQKNETGEYFLSDGRTVEQAVTRLGLYEDICEKLLRDQEEISARLEQLRTQGKKNSALFKEQMGRKLINSSILSLFQARGLL